MELTPDAAQWVQAAMISGRFATALKYSNDGTCLYAGNVIHGQRDLDAYFSGQLDEEDGD